MTGKEIQPNVILLRSPEFKKHAITTAFQLWEQVSDLRVSLQDHRFGRILYLLDHGVDPGVLRAVVMDHVGSHPEALESLGLLTALRNLPDAIRVATS